MCKHIMGLKGDKEIQTPSPNTKKTLSVEKKNILNVAWQKSL